MTDPMSLIRKELDEDLAQQLDARNISSNVLLLIKICRLLRQLRKESK